MLSFVLHSANLLNFISGVSGKHTGPKIHFRNRGFTKCVYACWTAESSLSTTAPANECTQYPMWMEELAPSRTRILIVHMHIKCRHNHIYFLFPNKTNDHRRNQTNDKRTKWSRDREKNQSKAYDTKTRSFWFCVRRFIWRPREMLRRRASPCVCASKSNIIEFVPIHVLSVCQSYSLYFHYDIRDMKKFLTPKFMYIMPNVLWSSCCRRHCCWCCCWRWWCWRARYIIYTSYLYSYTHARIRSCTKVSAGKRKRPRIRQSLTELRLGKNVCIALYLARHTNTHVWRRV